MRQRNEPTDTPGARYGEAWTPVAESKLTGPPRHLDIIHVQDLRDARRVPIDGDTKDRWAEWRSQDGYTLPVVDHGYRGCPKQGLIPPRAERCSVGLGRQNLNDVLSVKPERCAVGSQLGSTGTSVPDARP